MVHRITFHRSLIVLAILAVAALATIVVLLVAPSASAQQPTPDPSATFPITFSGPVESTGPRFIVVNGLLVDLAGAETPPAALVIGDVVTVYGSLQNNTVVAARVELGDQTSSLTVTPGGPTVTPPPLNLSGRDDDDDRPRRIVVQGPVRNITNNTIQIFNLNIQYDPTIVNVTNIQVGDNVRVQGDFTIVNNIYNIVAVNATVVNAPVFIGSDRITDRTTDRITDRDSRSAPPPAQPPPPPPPAAPRGSNGDSGRGSVSAPSGRDS